MNTQRRRRLQVPLTAFAAFLGASATPIALAAEESGANPELLIKPETAIPAMISAIIMFGLLFFLLKKSAWGPILNGLQAREVKIRSEIETAENARAQANAALERYQKELSEARAEASQMIQQARTDAQKVAEELRARNESELNAMKDRARNEIESAKRTALNEIYAETANLATRIAGKILEREITVDDESRLIEQALSELPKATKSNGATSN